MSAASRTVAARLPDLVGPGNVTTDPSDLSTYAVDGKAPAAAVRPGADAEIAEVVKYAVAEKLALIPSGARTKLGIGAPPSRYDIALDMTRLDRVISYDPGDLTLSVEAGIPLAKLSAALAAHRQFLPLLVPYFDRATVGGTIATAIDSPLRQFYGTARDYVLGMEFVCGDGVHSKSGGRVVKNVTGYDLHKLMIGTLGTLGVITRVNFKTFPSAVGSRAFLATFDSAEQAIRMRHAIAQSPLTPLTLEVLSPSAALLLATASKPNPPPGSAPGVLSPKHWTLAAAHAGKPEVLARYETDLRRMAAECRAANVAVLNNNVQLAVWDGLREFVPAVLASSPAATVMKISVVPSRLREALDAAVLAAGANELPWAAIARGLGVIYFALLPKERNDDSARRIAAATNQIFAAVAPLEANATIPWCPADWKAGLKLWGLERNDLAQMQKVKKIFDPQGIFSPGRFVGGI